MAPDRRDILQRVASGELSPEEAETLLDEEVEGETTAQAPEQGSMPLRKIKVSAGFGSIAISADPDVAEADIEGQHSASLDGDTLVVHGDLDAITPGIFSFEERRGRPRHRSRRKGRGSRGRFPSTLRVRVNPAIEVDARLDAGPLHIGGVRAPIRARCGAGPITIEDATGPLDVAVNAGAIRVDTKLSEGSSRIRSDAGAVRIDLDPDSSVHVVARAVLGKVVLPDTQEDRRGLGSMQETTIGDGAATLHVETAMGSVNVTTRGGSLGSKSTPPSDMWTAPSDP
jgi:hypothetical protein